MKKKNKTGWTEALRGKHYRGTLLIRKCHPIGPYSRTMPRALMKS